MTDRAAMTAQAEAALRARWAVCGAPDPEACAAIREALAIYHAPCTSWQQFLDEALALLGIAVDWRPGGIVRSFSFDGSVQPWGDHAVADVWPEAPPAREAA